MNTYFDIALFSLFFFNSFNQHVITIEKSTPIDLTLDITIILFWLADIITRESNVLIQVPLLLLLGFSLVRYFNNLIKGND